MTALWGFLSSFGLWILGGALALLSILFSPTLRKYTLGVLAVCVLLGAVYIFGYNSNQNVEIKTHSCDDFRKVLVSGPATDKAIRIFIKHGLCE